MVTLTELTFRTLDSPSLLTLPRILLGWTFGKNTMAQVLHPPLATVAPLQRPGEPTDMEAEGASGPSTSQGWWERG